MTNARRARHCVAEMVRRVWPELGDFADLLDDVARGVKRIGEFRASVRQAYMGNVQTYHIVRCASHDLRGWPAERWAWACKNWIIRDQPNSPQINAKSETVCASLMRCAFPQHAPDMSRYRCATTIKLASAIRADRDWAALPMLKDALIDAGCGHADVLRHCDPNIPHSVACYILEGLSPC